MDLSEAGTVLRFNLLPEGLYMEGVLASLTTGLTAQVHKPPSLWMSAQTFDSRSLVLVKMWP